MLNRQLHSRPGLRRIHRHRGRRQLSGFAHEGELTRELAHAFQRQRQSAGQGNATLAIKTGRQFTREVHAAEARQGARALHLATACAVTRDVQRACRLFNQDLGGARGHAHRHVARRQVPTALAIGIAHQGHFEVTLQHRLAQLNAARDGQLKTLVGCVEHHVLKAGQRNLLGPRRPVNHRRVGRGQRIRRCIGSVRQSAVDAQAARTQARQAVASNAGPTHTGL